MLFAFWRQWRKKKAVASLRRAPSGKWNSTILSVEGLESRDLLSGFTPQYVLVPQSGSAAPLSTTGPTGYSPSQLSQAYGFNQIYFQNGTIKGDGSGQTIAIVDAYDDPTIANDLHQFDRSFGLPDPSFTKVNQNGGSAMPAADSGWATEIALDVEWAHAMAPGARILLVEANSNSEADLFSAVQYAAHQPGVSAVSMSWGGGEFSSESSYDSVFSTPSGHAGVAFIASSGDSGAPASYPAVSPNVLAVGGTSLYLTASKSYSSESGWSGSTGGLSYYETQPSYQHGAVSQSTTQRASPDVAYDANPYTGVSVYDSYGNSAAPWLQVGGTSAGAPQWAALVAIADQGRALNGLGTLDGSKQLLPALYGLPASDFHDVTSGGSSGSPSFAAGPGYDLVTGRGSPLANLVVNGLVGQSTSTGNGGSSGTSGSGSGAAPPSPPVNTPTSPIPSPSPTPSPSPSPSPSPIPVQSPPTPVDEVGRDALFMVQGWKAMNLSLFLQGWQDFEATVLANQSMALALEQTLYFDLRADLLAAGY